MTGFWIRYTSMSSCCCLIWILSYKLTNAFAWSILLLKQLLGITSNYVPSMILLQLFFMQRSPGRTNSGIGDGRACVIIYRAKSETIFKDKTIVSKIEECLYLWMLLHHVIGLKSFADLRFFQGNVSSTYVDACFRRGLLQDDSHRNMALKETVECEVPRQMHCFFRIMLIFRGALGQ